MNILVLCLSSGKGGLELYVQRELRWLRDSGHVCYAAVSGDSVFLDKKNKCVFEYCIINRLSRFSPVMSAYKISKIIDRHKIDVLHIHWARDLNLAVFAKLLSRRDVRLIYTRHMGITRPKKDFYHRFLYREVHKLIVGTKLLYEEASRYLPLPDSSIEQLYIGVPDVLVNQDRCREILVDSKLGNRKFKIGLFGRIEHGKGQHILIDAVSKLSNKGCDLGVAIIGHVMDDEYLSNLKLNIEKNQLGDYVQLFGYMDEVSSIMGCFDVIILTTYCETFGLVLAEAMRAGVAVVGSNAGGVPEIIEDGVSGLLFESGSPDALADAVESLMDDEYRSRLAAAGKKRADLLFSEDVHFQHLESLLLGS